MLMFTNEHYDIGPSVICSRVVGILGFSLVQTLYSETVLLVMVYMRPRSTGQISTYLLNEQTQFANAIFL